MALAASVLLAVFGYFMLQPGLEPTSRASIAAADAQTIYWRVELLGDNQELRVQVQSPHALEAGQWRAAPRAQCRAARGARRGQTTGGQPGAFRGARPPGFRPGRFCTSHPCLPRDWPT